MYCVLQGNSEILQFDYQSNQFVSFQNISSYYTEKVAFFEISGNYYYAFVLE